MKRLKLLIQESTHLPHLLFKMPKDKPLHIERMSANRVLRRGEPYERHRSHDDPAPKIDPAPPLERRTDHYKLYYSIRDRPAAPNAIKRTKAVEYTLCRGLRRMPAEGCFWNQQRCDDSRTVTEDDLVDLKEARAKYARDWSGEPWCKDAGTQTDEPLKLYKLTRSENAPATYDNYTDAVVVARNDDEAKFIHPGLGPYNFTGSEKPWWEWGGRLGASSSDAEFSTRQEAYSHDISMPSQQEECPPHYLGPNCSDWPHPAYVRAVYFCDYYGTEKAGHIVSSSYWSG